MFAAERAVLIYNWEKKGGNLTAQYNHVVEPVCHGADVFYFTTPGATVKRLNS